MLGAGAKGKVRVPSLCGSGISSVQWCVLGVRAGGRFTGLSYSSAKNMLSSGLEDSVVRLLSVRSRRWMVICKNGINHWTLNCRLLHGNPLRASKHSAYMPMSSFKNASNFSSSPYICTHFFIIYKALPCGQFYLLHITILWSQSFNVLFLKIKKLRPQVVEFTC